MASTWVTIEPNLHTRRAREIGLEFARSLARLNSDNESGIDELLEELVEKAAKVNAKDRQRIATLGRVFADVAKQGWAFRVRGQALAVQPPNGIAADPAAEKQRVRRQEQLKRDEQLRQPAVQEFIRSMERRRLHNGRFVSIFSLMRDGRELAQSLRAARGGCADDLRKAIAPYVQFANAGERCSWTGLELLEIWRYFRHTWSNQYTSVPGRTMLVLVRDAAADFHPVIGIAALSSPIVQIRERDEWIGWHPPSFLEEIKARPTDRIARWLVNVVDRAVEDIYVEDLVRDGIVKLKELKSPDATTLSTLISEGAKQRSLHHRYVKAQELKSVRRTSEPAEDSHWRTRAEAHLFRSKRSLALADLLAAQMVLKRYLGVKPNKEQLTTLLQSSEGVHVVKRIIRKAKAERVGIAMADITVCGAVAPYNAILGGKLVSMLVTSPEVVRAYHERYARAESEIASSIAGRPIVRPPHLVFVGTTSLYGIGSSQYNRVKIPCEELGGSAGEVIEYVRLGLSEAFGTSHYADETIEELERLVMQENGGQRVNSIFGEGVSPKMRKVREALELLNLPPELFLKHGRKRILYGIKLVRNARDFLLGLDDKPDYLIPKNAWHDASRRIADWWSRRWLSGRILSEEVLAEVARHALVHPIVHGARVVLPTPEPSAQGSLFEHLERTYI